MSATDNEQATAAPVDEVSQSASDTATSTAATTDEVFHEAMRCYEKALRSGIQLQEESVNLWKDLLIKLGSPEELQAKARKLMEEFVETFNRTSNQRIDLFEKMLGVYKATSVTDAQRCVHDLIESSLTRWRKTLRT